jgi:hypothetical protein
METQSEGARSDGAAEVIEPFNKYQVDSSPTEVVIRVPPIGALSRKDVFTLASYLVLHGAKLDDGSTQGDFDDYLDALIHEHQESGVKVTVTRDERDAAKIEKLTTELAAANQLLTEIAEREQAEQGQIKETKEERRLRGELQASLDRETKMELQLKELRDSIARADADAHARERDLHTQLATAKETIASLRKDVDAFASGARKP